MKKIILILVCLFGFMYNAFALDNDKFHKDYVIGDYGYIYNKNGSIYYTMNYKAILKDDTNELVYCVEPGTRLSSDSYERLYNYSDKLNFSSEKMEKVKLIGFYGYLYKDHTDIKWYEATQYLIWQTVKPDNWDIYFVDSNQNKIELYPDEVNEILSLVDNHHNKPNINELYEVNYLDDLIIEDEYLLLDNYSVEGALINNNKLIIKGDLMPGDYTFNLSTKLNENPTFYVNKDSQNIFKRGNILDNNININVHVTAGKININECNMEYYKDEFIGGTYEVLNIDDEVVDEITCNINEDCLSKTLPVGSYKIRIKNLNDEYEFNEHIYDVNVVDGDNSSVTVCSLKKNRNIIINNDININDSHNLSEVNNNFFSKINIYFLNKIEDDDLSMDNSSNILASMKENQVKYISDNSDMLDKSDEGKNSTCLCESDNKYIDDKNLNNTSDSEKIIDIPNTSKDSYFFPTLIFVVVFAYLLLFFKREKNI